MKSPGGSIVASFEDVESFFAVHTPPDYLISTNFEQQGVVPKVVFNIFEKLVFRLGRHPFNNEIPRVVRIRQISQENRQNGQTRTRKSEEHKGSQRFKAEAKKSQLWSSSVKESQLSVNFIEEKAPSLVTVHYPFQSYHQSKTKGFSKLKGTNDYSSEVQHDGRVRCVKSSTLIGSLKLEGHVAMKKAQGEVGFTLLSLTKQAQAVTSKE
ncbi:hypothetical protein Tco_0925114 [Tanacetum coccineum]|uniref:Uncharacterized protein n=1 Tax=Tanacetum coccineum TaxID=301880 RepID=A0ABQ5D5Y5_9ASTR